MRGLVLSLFPGAGLLDAAFSDAGFCVVRGPDLLLGQDIRRFTLAGLRSSDSGGSRFDGIIAGPPCQDFSRARRRPPSGYGLEMLTEACRLITEGAPEWWLIECVPGIPTINLPGYSNQRFNLFASEFGLQHRRNRSFQFGASSGPPLTIARGSQSQFENGGLMPTPTASTDCRRNFADFAELMGLPRNFTLPGLSRSAKFRAVGNGVAVPMGRAVAVAIRDRRVTNNARACPCNCGRPLTGRQRSATVACRKRLQRTRQGHAPEVFTPAASRLAAASTSHAGAVTQAELGHVRRVPGAVTVPSAAAGLPRLEESQFSISSSHGREVEAGRC